MGFLFWNFYFGVSILEFLLWGFYFGVSILEFLLWGFYFGVSILEFLLWGFYFGFAHCISRILYEGFYDSTGFIPRGDGCIPANLLKTPMSGKHSFRETIHLVISKLLKRHSKAKPAYSRALRRIRAGCPNCSPE